MKKNSLLGRGSTQRFVILLSTSYIIFPNKWSLMKVTASAKADLTCSLYDPISRTIKILMGQRGLVEISFQK